MDFLPFPSLTHFVHSLRADVSFPAKNKVRVAKNIRIGRCKYKPIYNKYVSFPAKNKVRVAKNSSSISQLADANITNAKNMLIKIQIMLKK